MSKTPIEITPTEITDKILQENTRLTERANDLERIMNMVKEENVVLKKELIRIELKKETDAVEVVYDADLPVDVKKVVKKRAPKKKVVKEMVLVDSVDAVPPVVKDECPCVATDMSKYSHMKKPELIALAVSLGLKGVKKLTRSGIIEAIAKHENGGVQPIMDMISV